MNILAVIPARSGSKGVPHKNVRMLVGKPLIAYSIATARRCSAIGRTIVSTDSAEYAKLSREYGAETPFLRPSEISGDTSTDYDFFKHLLDWLGEHEGSIPDLLIHLRPTTPFRDPQLVNLAISEFLQDTSSTALRSVHEMSETAYKQFELDSNTGYLKTICEGKFDVDTANNSRQVFSKTYVPNGYVDIVRSEFILKHKLLHGNRVRGFITPFSTEVDAIDDFAYLEWQISRDKKILDNLFVK